MFNNVFFYKFYEKIFMNNYINFLYKNYFNRANLFKKKIIIFDVGCYRGTFSNSLLKLLKKKKVFFFI